jgi:MFS family permease
MKVAPSSPALNNASTLLGLNRQTTILLVAILIIGAGEEMWMRFLPKYLEALGASVFLIAAFDAIKTLLGAVYAYPGGIVTDRFGHRAAFLGFTAVSIAGYLLLVLLPFPGGVIAAMFLFLAWSDFSLPATFSLVAQALPSNKHAMGIGMQSLIRRIPVIVGPIAGGILIDQLGIFRGVRTGACISIVLAIFAGVLLNRLVQQTPEPAPLHGFSGVVRNFSTPLRRLLLSDILIRFCERLPFAWTVIYAMDRGISATDVGVLVAIEMAAAIACYVPASLLADRYGKEPFVIATFVMYTLFPLVLAGAHTFPAFAIAFAVRGLKEFGEPARKSLILSYSPANARGATVGAYYLIRDTIVTTGSFIGAALWIRGPMVMFLSSAGIGMIATVVYAISLRRNTSTIIGE